MSREALAEAVFVPEVLHEDLNVQADSGTAQCFELTEGIPVVRLFSPDDELWYHFEVLVEPFDPATQIASAVSDVHRIPKGALMEDLVPRRKSVVICYRTRSVSGARIWIQQGTVVPIGGGS